MDRAQEFGDHLRLSAARLSTSVAPPSSCDSARKTVATVASSLNCTTSSVSASARDPGIVRESVRESVRKKCKQKCKRMCKTMWRMVRPGDCPGCPVGPVGSGGPVGTVGSGGPVGTVRLGGPVGPGGPVYPACLLTESIVWTQTNLEEKNVLNVELASSARPMLCGCALCF